MPEFIGSCLGMTRLQELAAVSPEHRVHEGSGSRAASSVEHSLVRSFRIDRSSHRGRHELRRRCHGHGARRRDGLRVRRRLAARDCMAHLARAYRLSRCRSRTRAVGRHLDQRQRLPRYRCRDVDDRDAPSVPRSLPDRRALSRFLSRLHTPTDTYGGRRESPRCGKNHGVTSSNLCLQQTSAYGCRLDSSVS